MIAEEEKQAGSIFLVNKPLGWTSFKVVKKIKWLAQAKKAGHAGTLDPLATGLLIVCTEKKTKQIPEIQAAEKEYTGCITLGVTRPSYDMETDVNATFPTEHITEKLINEILPSFMGEIQQVPPLHSAIKVNGKRAYKLARQGVQHTLDSRNVTIRELEITRFQLPELHFRVVCSKGTYIRSLANDIGKALGSGGYLSSLVRTRIGNYTLKDAKTPDEWQELLKPDNNKTANHV